FTAAPGMASLTVAMKMSPIEAQRRRVPPSTLMTSTSFAPLLSATRMRLSCWIIRVPPPTILCPPDCDRPPSPWLSFTCGSLCVLQYVAVQSPLPLRERAGLLNADTIALTGVVGLVVYVQLLRPLDELGVAGVADAFDDGDDHGLVHLGGHHDPFPDLPGGTR